MSSIAYATSSAGQSQREGARGAFRSGPGSIFETSRAREHFGTGRHSEHQTEYHQQGVLSRSPDEVRSAESEPRCRGTSTSCNSSADCCSRTASLTSSKASAGIAFNPRSRRRRGVGKSSPIVNVLWGFANLAAGFAILWSFLPKGADVVLEWVAVGLGVLAMAIFLAWHFGRVRSRIGGSRPRAPCGGRSASRCDDG